MPAKTSQIAKDIYQKIKPLIGKKAIILALVGPMGAGKTTFTKALAKQMGIEETVVSPTFTLHGEYGLLDHIDLWRVEDPAELTALGLEEMVADKKVIVIEWAEKAAELINSYKKQAEVIWINFLYTNEDGEREITFS